jgi:hypothetical protein
MYDYDSKNVLEVARNIRLHLHKLLGTEAIAFDRALFNLLAKVEPGEAVDNQILELLVKHDATREWTIEFLSHKVEAGEAVDERILEFIVNPSLWKDGIPHILKNNIRLYYKIVPISTIKYVCQETNCDYVWYRLKAGFELPNECPKNPNHQRPLILAKDKEA